MRKSTGTNTIFSDFSYNPDPDNDDFVFRPQGSRCDIGAHEKNEMEVIRFVGPAILNPGWIEAGSEFLTIGGIYGALAPSVDGDKIVIRAQINPNDGNTVAYDTIGVDTGISINKSVQLIGQQNISTSFQIIPYVFQVVKPTIDCVGVGRAFNLVSDGVTIEGLTFIGGDSPIEGGALNISGANARIIHCEFGSNTSDDGGAIYATSAAGGLRISRSIFHDNTSNGATVTSGGGAIYLTNQNTIIDNCLFYANSASLGVAGAIYADRGTGISGTLDIYYCTFYDNFGAPTYAVYTSNDVIASVKNSIFHHLIATDNNYINMFGSDNVTFSRIDSSVTGNGNITNAPTFVDRLLFDFHLDPSSVDCIDTGEEIPNYYYDIEGYSHPLGEENMGAYEKVY